MAALFSFVALLCVVLTVLSEEIHPAARSDVVLGDDDTFVNLVPNETMSLEIEEAIAHAIKLSGEKSETRKKKQALRSAFLSRLRSKARPKMPESQLPNDSNMLMSKEDMEQMPKWDWYDESWVGSEIGYDESLPIPRILYAPGDLCAKNHGLLVHILVIPHRVGDRQWFRTKMPIWTDKRVAPAFLVGRISKSVNGKSPKEWDEILLEEAKEQGDMIIGDFVDSYENLPIKTTMGLLHHAIYCPNPELRWKVKMDADTLINWQELWRRLTVIDRYGLEDNFHKADGRRRRLSEEPRSLLAWLKDQLASDTQVSGASREAEIHTSERRILAAVKNVTSWEAANIRKLQERARILKSDLDPIWLGQRWTQMPVVHNEHHRNYEANLPDLHYFPPYISGPVTVSNRRFAEKFLHERLRKRIILRNEDAMLGVIMNGTGWYPQHMDGWAWFGWGSIDVSPKCGKNSKPSDCPCTDWVAVHQGNLEVEKALRQCIKRDSFAGLAKAG